MDEADRLLDMGFRPAIERICRSLPPPGQRQSLMFTATVPQGVREVAAIMMGGGKGGQGVASIDCVKGDDGPGHKAIRQEHLVVPGALVMPALWRVLRAHMAAEPAYKVIVFFTTARAAQFFAELTRAAGQPVS